MDLSFLVYSFIALFIIVDPVANVPVFLGMLEGISEAGYRRAVKRASVMAMLVLLIFTYAGAYFFRYLGIELYSFRIAGGVLLFIIAMEMLFGRRTRTELAPEEESVRADELSITPLAVPLLTGPGAITTGIVLQSRAQGVEESLMLGIAVVLVFLTSWAILANARRIYLLLGDTGTRVVTRLMGLLLASIAVQFIVDGVREALREVSR